MGHDLPSQDAFVRFRKVNVEGLMNIVYEAERCNVKRFIHVSSTAAMGLLKENLVDEDDTRALLNNIPVGSHIRFQLTANKHSIILAKKTDDYVEVYHCNYPIYSQNYTDDKGELLAKKCLITYEQLTYEDFNTNFKHIIYYNPVFPLAVNHKCNTKW